MDCKGVFSDVGQLTPEFWRIEIGCWKIEVGYEN
jgi:hypothetical protein